MPDEEIAETEPTSEPETSAEVTAEVALDQAETAHDRITDIQEQLDQIFTRLSQIESNASNDRQSELPSGYIEPIASDIPADHQPETPGSPSDDQPIIRPNREHPYFRKLW